MENSTNYFCCLCQENLRPGLNDINFTDCAHSLCFSCFPYLVFTKLNTSGFDRDYLESETLRFSCPRCQKPSGILTNIEKLLLFFESNLQKKKSKDGDTCESCEENKAVFICTNCENQKYCKLCFNKTHYSNTNKKFGKHVWELLNEKLKFKRRPSFKCRCQANKLMEFFCNACQKAICKYCMKVDHDTHGPMIPLSDFLEEGVSNFFGISTTLKNFAIKMDGFQKSFQVSLNDAKIISEKEINDFIESSIRTLKGLQEERMNSIQKYELKMKNRIMLLNLSNLFMSKELDNSIDLPPNKIYWLKELFRQFPRFTESSLSLKPFSLEHIPHDNYQEFQNIFRYLKEKYKDMDLVKVGNNGEIRLDYEENSLLDADAIAFEKKSKHEFHAKTHTKKETFDNSKLPVSEQIERYKQNKSSYSISFCDLEIKWSEAEEIAKILKTSDSIKLLHFSNVTIGNYGMREILEALTNNKYLNEIYLEDIELRGIEMSLITQALILPSSSLTDLKLIGIRISDLWLMEFCEALKINKGLRTIHIVQHHQDVKSNRSSGAIILSNVLKENSTLKYVHLESVNIGDEGAKAIAEALKINKSLNYLGLLKGGISAVGAGELAEALKSNDCLTEMRLFGNKIGDLGAKKLANALTVNKTLKKVILSKCSIGESGAKELALALQTIKSQGSIRLNGIKLGEAEKNLSFHLELSKSVIGKEGMKGIGLKNRGFRKRHKLLVVEKVEKESLE